MKSILKITGGLFLVLSMMSCGNDDDNARSNADLIIGTWQLDSETENGQQIQLDDCERRATVQFIGDIFTSTFYDDFDNPGTCEVDETFSASYNVSGNMLSVTSFGLTDTIEITTLNDSILVLTETDTDEDGTFVYVTTFIRL